MVLVLDFRFGERGLIVDAPQRRAQAFIEVSFSARSASASTIVASNVGSIVRYGRSKSPKPHAHALHQSRWRPSQKRARSLQRAKLERIDGGKSSSDA